MSAAYPRKSRMTLFCLAVFTGALAAGFFVRLAVKEDRRSGNPSTPRTMEITIYLIADSGQRYYLQPVKRTVDAGGEPVRAALEELIKGPEEESGLLPVVPPTVRIRSLEVEGGICRLDLSKEYILDAPAIGVCAATERLSLAAIGNTLTELEGISAVVLEVEGLRRGAVDGRYVEDLWGFFGLPDRIERDVSLIGPPGLDKNMAARIPAWKRIDKRALAASLGWGEVVRGPLGVRKVALTFDAGASGLPTPAILDSLHEAGVQATFFLTGQFSDSYPDLVRRMAEEGHELANHSYTHPRFTEISAEEAEDQITRTEQRIRELTGLSTKPYFRFPYGARDSSLVRLVNSLGYLSVFWTVDSLDWEEGITPEQVRQRVVSAAVPGAIILMHCGSPQEAQILSLVIEDLRNMGYEMVTLSELLAAGSETIEQPPPFTPYERSGFHRKIGAGK